MNLSLTSICERTIPFTFAFPLNTSSASIDRSSFLDCIWVRFLCRAWALHHVTWSLVSKACSLTWIRCWNSSPSPSTYSVDNTAFSFLKHAGEVLHNWTLSLVLLYKSSLILNVLILDVLCSCLALLASCHLHFIPSKSASSTLLFCESLLNNQFLIVLLAGNLSPVMPQNHLCSKMLQDTY